jgi:hypothetical protein
MYEEMLIDFKTTCECIPMDHGGTYTLSCEESRQSCDGVAECGWLSYTELIDPYGTTFETMMCFEHTQGDLSMLWRSQHVCRGIKLQYISE